MGVYIKTKDGLKKVSVDSCPGTGSNPTPNPTPAEVTAESIKNALGYTPANADRVANIEDDGSGEYYIVDADGNIIFKIDADGLHTTAIEAQSLTLNGEAVVPGGTSSGDGDGGSGGGTVTIPSELTAHVSKKDNPHNVTAAQLGLDTVKNKSEDLVNHLSDKNNPHGVTATQVGLGNVDNTADIDKPVSTQQQAALNALRNALSEQIVSQEEEFHIVDADGNIVASIDANGVHSVDFKTADGKSFKDYVDEKIAEIPTSENSDTFTDVTVTNELRFKPEDWENGGTTIYDSSDSETEPVLMFRGNSGGRTVRLSNIRNPEGQYDVANKKYVDDAIANAGGSAAEGYGTRGLEYTLSDDGTYYTVSGIGTATDVKQLVIPYIHNSLPVTSIGLTAFQNNTVIESVSIPDSVTTIGTAAFQKCSNLRKVTVGNGLIALANRAFQECTSLTEVVLPEGLVTIGLNAFVKCTALERVYIPKSATTVGTTLFTNCTNLTVYCGASEAASGWNSSWNDANRPVVWGVKAPTKTHAFSADSATTANALKSGYNVNGAYGSEISVSFNTGRVYVIMVENYGATYTGIFLCNGTGETLLFNPSGTGHIKCKYTSGTSTISFSDGTTSMSVGACYIREL